MQKGFTVWFTGLPSSGKSTLARMLESVIQQRGFHVEVFDGDEVRLRLSKGLGFSKQDRDENIRRIAYVARLVTRSGGVAITCAISPYREIRDGARKEIGRFVEVFVRCPVEKCIERDVKGLYKKALNGEIQNFTGISDPYEEPLSPEVVVDSHLESAEESLAKIVRRLEDLSYIPPEGFSGVTDVPIPTYLYQEIQRRLVGSDSGDVPHYVTNLLMQTLGEPDETLVTSEEREEILVRLRDLGYLE
ncbi:MAG: adenylyl-sulfate kinase [Acidobacteria bacterium]|nr:adenylyl-sulfate kinase [Acidobacteriota bacterium]